MCKNSGGVVWCGSHHWAGLGFALLLTLKLLLDRISFVEARVDQTENNKQATISLLLLYVCVFLCVILFFSRLVCTFLSFNLSLSLSMVMVLEMDKIEPKSCLTHFICFSLFLYLLRLQLFCCCGLLSRIQRCLLFPIVGSIGL